MTNKYMHQITLTEGEFPSKIDWQKHLNSQLVNQIPMQKKIWKYELKITDNQNITMPKGAQILTVQTQFGTPCIWALVDPTQDLEIRHFETFGIGHSVIYDLGVDRNYIGTYQIQEGHLVYHLFEYTGV